MPRAGEVQLGDLSEGLGPWPCATQRASCARTQKKRQRGHRDRCCSHRTAGAPAPAPEGVARTRPAAPREKAQASKGAAVGTHASGSQLETAISVILTVHCARAASRIRATEGDDPIHGCGLFRAAQEPVLGIHDFLAKIRKELKCSKECLIIALIYIDRAAEQCPGLVIDNLTVHRLLLSGILLASKYMDDDGFDNAHYAKVGDISTSEMNALEASLLQALDWRLHVLPQDYDWYSELTCRVVHGS